RWHRAGRIRLQLARPVDTAAAGGRGTRLPDGGRHRARHLRAVSADQSRDGHFVRPARSASAHLMNRLWGQAAFIAVIVALAVAAPYLGLADPVRQDVAHRLSGP